MVDVFFFTADNTDITELVRLYRHPPVGELGEVDDNYIIRNSRDPAVSLKRKGMETKPKE